MDFDFKPLMLLSVMTVSVTACTFYPKKLEYYSDCNIKANKLVLEAEPIKLACATSYSDPSGKACLSSLIAFGVASAIVSGSIVVIGNTVYWLEEEGKCITKSTS